MVKEKDLKRELEIAISGLDTQLRCAARLGIRLNSFKIFLRKARRHGVDAVLHSNRPGSYEDSFKLEVVHSVLVDGMSHGSAAAKYNLAYSTVDGWVRKYKEGGESCLLADNRGRHGMGRKKKPRLEDYEPGAKEYLELKVKLLTRELELLKKAMPLVREKIRNRSHGQSGTSSSEN